MDSPRWSSRAYGAGDVFDIYQRRADAELEETERCHTTEVAILKKTFRAAKVAPTAGTTSQSMW